jgi:adenosylhomocysteine nucleosidase
MIDVVKYPMPVNIIVAHGLEAKALVKMLELERHHASSEFVEYSNSNKLRLLVSGIGKEAITAAVTYLGEQQASDSGEIRAWLNIGIAGHRDVSLGKAWLGNKITDQSSGASAYPPQLIEGIEVGSVVTVDEPETSYPLDAAYEMEASAFYAEATKYSTAELVQVFKVISDNLENPISEIDIRIVPGLIAAQAPQLQILIEGMSGVAAQHNSSQRLPSYFSEVCSKIHLTVNQKLQLRRLCQRYKALGMEEVLSSAADLRVGDARTLIQQLAERIDRMGEA